MSVELRHDIDGLKGLSWLDSSCGLMVIPSKSEANICFAEIVQPSISLPSHAASTIELARMSRHSIMRDIPSPDGPGELPQICTPHPYGGRSPGTSGRRSSRAMYARGV